MITKTITNDEYLALNNLRESMLELHIKEIQKILAKYYPKDEEIIITSNYWEYYKSK